MAVRMRFIKQAVEELRAMDPNTPITENYLRGLVKEGVIPHVKVGNRRQLLNFDQLLDFLENPDGYTKVTTASKPTTSGIRKIQV